MKKRYPAIAALALFVLSSPQLSHSQAHVNSSNGYTAHIIVLPVAVLPSTTNCPWGYNYNLRVNYTVNFTGNNIPASLYTLQGYIRCGGDNHFFDLPNNGGVGNANSVSNVWNSATNCGSANVMNMNCNTARIQINGPGIASQTVNFPISYAILPVNLIDFSASVKGNKVKIGWQTASESNNDYFAIERSADGNTWNEIARIDGAGNSDSIRSYQWYDLQPLQGTSFYRLNMKDINGNNAFSGIKTVQYNSGKNGITIYPVPNAGNTINLAGVTDFNRHQFSVINGNGLTVFSTTLTSTQVELPVLTPGIYIVSVKNTVSGETQNMRYVKL